MIDLKCYHIVKHWHMAQGTGQKIKLDNNWKGMSNRRVEENGEK